MPLPPLPESAVIIAGEAGDWRQAVLLAGVGLARSGATLDTYGARMVDVVDEFGAYIVIAPGLALAHARPGPDVIHDGLSVVTLADPVPFGHPHNDPVCVVIGLAVRSPDSHVTSVAELANIFNHPEAIPALARASSPAEVLRIMSVTGEGE